MHKKEKAFNIKSRTKYLFSVDLEDIRMSMPDNESYKDRLVINTEKYLEFLDSISSRCTFFVVGQVAQKYPDLIKRINSCGHELACHSMNHTPLNKLSPMEFEDDVEKNMEFMYKAGASDLRGFRAPFFSITKDTIWAYNILKKLGFRYSSSVLPAKNPLYGWPGFGEQTKEILKNFYEVPITLSGFPIVIVPFAGGVYFRVLPFILIKYLFKNKQKSSNYIRGYFHPHDIDTEQERFMHPGIKQNRFYNMLLYYNRHKVLKRLILLANNISIITYRKYISDIIKA